MFRLSEELGRTSATHCLLGNFLANRQHKIERHVDSLRAEGLLDLRPDRVVPDRVQEFVPCIGQSPRNGTIDVGIACLRLAIDCLNGSCFFEQRFVLSHLLFVERVELVRPDDGIGCACLLQAQQDLSDDDPVSLHADLQERVRV